MQLFAYSLISLRLRIMNLLSGLHLVLSFLLCWYTGISVLISKRTGELPPPTILFGRGLLDFSQREDVTFPLLLPFARLHHLLVIFLVLFVLAILIGILHILRLMLLLVGLLVLRYPLCLLRISLVLLLL